MHYPTSRKVDKKRVRRTNFEDRQDLIEQMGEEYFYSHSEFSNLYDIPVPSCFLYVWSIFLEVFNLTSEQQMTWQDIYAYSQIRDITLQQIEIDYIIKIYNMAVSKISEMRDSEE